VHERLLHRDHAGGGRFLSVSAGHTSRDKRVILANEVRLLVTQRSLEKHSMPRDFVSGLANAGALEDTLHQRVEYASHTLLRVTFPRKICPPLPSNVEDTLRQIHEHAAGRRLGISRVVAASRCYASRAEEPAPSDNHQDETGW